LLIARRITCVFVISSSRSNWVDVFYYLSRIWFYLFKLKTMIWISKIFFFKAAINTLTHQTQGGVGTLSINSGECSTTEQTKGLCESVLLWHQHKPCWH
jgi:uncharacterized protein YybS (DUF2232 family)